MSGWILGPSQSSSQPLDLEGTTGGAGSGSCSWWLSLAEGLAFEAQDWA